MPVSREKIKQQQQQNPESTAAMDNSSIAGVFGWPSKNPSGVATGTPHASVANVDRVCFTNSAHSPIETGTGDSVLVMRREAPDADSSASAPDAGTGSASAPVDACMRGPMKEARVFAAPGQGDVASATSSTGHGAPYCAPSAGTRQPECISATALSGSHSPRRLKKETSVTELSPSLYSTVVSVSTTVVNYALEPPLPGFDPVVAPFSSKRIERVPVIRIYGLVNEAFSQLALHTDYPCGGAPHASSRFPSPKNKIRPTHSGPRSRSTCILRVAGQSASSTRPLLTQESSVNSSRTRSSASMLSGLRDTVSIRCPSGRDASSNDQSAVFLPGDSSAGDSSYYAVLNQSRASNGKAVGHNVVASSAEDSTSAGVVASRAKGSGLPAQAASFESFFRSCLGPPPACSAVARALQFRGGGPVRPLNSLKGRTCCAAVHGVLPYFFVPLPLEAHARPRRWLRWFCCRLREAEQHLQRQSPPPARRPVGRGSSSALGQSCSVGGLSAATPCSCAAEAADASGEPQQHEETNHARYCPRSHKQSNVGATHEESDILIYDVQLVWRRSIYGYDHVPRLFAQIFTLQPGLQTKQLAGMLLQGSVTGELLQPFEVHIPYTIHFLADYNVRGMDMLVVCNPMFVAPLVLSPAQVCTEDDLLLMPVAPLFPADETSEVATRDMERYTHQSSEYSKLTERESSDIISARVTKAEVAAGTASALLTQPPAGVLVLKFWRDLWHHLSRTAAELEAADSRRYATTFHRNFHSDAGACAGTARQGDGAAAHAGHPGVTAAPICSVCCAERWSTTVRGNGASLDGSSGCACSVLQPSLFCSKVGPSYVQASAPECCPTPQNGIRELRLFNSRRRGHEKGSGASSDGVLRSTLVDGNNDAGILGSGGTHPEESRQSRVGMGIHRNDSRSFGRRESSNAPVVSKSATDLQLGTPYRNDTSDNQDTSAGISNRKSTKRQPDTRRCTSTPRHRRTIGETCNADGTLLKPAAEVLRPYLPISKRRTSCEIEFHLVASQILNPFLDEAAEGLLCPQYDSLGQAPSDTTNAPMPQKPLLAAVRDYWKEEAVRAAALGLTFPILEFPAKLTPPPTLPPAAVAALEHRRRSLAREAVPQAYKDMLRRLLTRAGVLPSVAQTQHRSPASHWCGNRQLHEHQQEQGPSPLSPPQQLLSQEEQRQDQRFFVSGGGVHLRRGPFQEALLSYQTREELPLATPRDMLLHQSAQHISGALPSQLWATCPRAAKDLSGSVQSVGQDADLNHERGCVSNISGAGLGTFSPSAVFPSTEKEVRISGDYLREVPGLTAPHHVARSAPAAAEGHDEDVCFLLSLSQEAPSPSGLSETSRSQIEKSIVPSRRNSVHSTPSEQLSSFPYGSLAGAGESSSCLPRSSSRCSAVSDGADAAVDFDVRLPLAKRSPGAAHPGGHIAVAAGAVAAATALTNEPSDVLEPNYAEYYSPITKEHLARRDMKHVTANVLRDASSIRSYSNPPVVDAKKAPLAVRAYTYDQHCGITFETKDASIARPPAEYGPAQAQKQGTSTGFRKAVARALTGAQANRFHDGTADVDFPATTNTTASTGNGRQNLEKGYLRNTFSFGGEIEAQQPTSSGRRGALQSASHSRLPQTRSRGQCKSTAERRTGGGTPMAVKLQQLCNASSLSKDGRETEGGDAKEILTSYLRKRIRRRRDDWRPTHTQGSDTKLAEPSSTDSGYGASDDSSDSAASSERIDGADSNDDISRPYQRGTWSSCRFRRRNTGDGSVAEPRSQGSQQQQPHLQQAPCVPCEPRRCARGLRNATWQIFPRQDKQTPLQVDMRGKEQQSSPVRVNGEQSPKVSSARLASDDLERGTQAGEHEETGETGRRGGNYIVAQGAPQEQSSAARTAPAGATAVCSEAAAVPKETTLHGKEGSCLKTESSVSSHDVRVVLSNEDQSRSQSDSVRTEQRTAGSALCKDTCKVSSPSAWKQQQQQSRICVQKKSMQLRQTTAGVADDTRASLAQEISRKTGFTGDTPFPRDRSFSMMQSDRFASRGQGRTRTVDLCPLGPCSSMPHISHLMCRGGHAHLRQQNESPEEKLCMEKEQGRGVLHKKSDAEVVLEGWPDVPVQLPFYGDPRDCPSHSLRSAVLAACVCSDTQQAGGQRKTIVRHKYEHNKASREQHSPRPAAAYHERQQLKVRFGQLSQAARQRKRGEALNARHATTSTVAGAHRNLLDDGGSSARSQWQQQPHIQERPHSSCGGSIPERSAKMDAEVSHYEARSSVAIAQGKSEMSDSTVTPLGRDTHQTIYVGNQCSEDATERQYVAQKTSVGCTAQDSNREMWPPAQLISWRFCKSPPSRNSVFNTCPTEVKRLLRRLARRAERRQRQITKKPVRAAISLAQSNNRGRPRATLSRLCSATPSVNWGTKLSGGERSTRAKHVTTWAHTRKRGLKPWLAAFSPTLRSCQIAAARPCLFRLSQGRTRVCRFNAIQHVSLESNLTTERRVAQPRDCRGAHEQRSMQQEVALTRASLRHNLQQLDPRQCIVSGSATEVITCRRGSTTMAASSRMVSGRARNRGVGTTESSSLFVKGRNRQREDNCGAVSIPVPQVESKVSFRGHTPSQQTPQLCHENSGLAESADYVPQAHPVPHWRTRTTSRCQFSPYLRPLVPPPLLCEPLVEQALSSLAGTDVAGGHNDSRTGAPTETVVSPTSIQAGSPSPAFMCGYTSVYASRGASSPAASTAGTASTLGIVSACDAERQADASVRGSELTSFKTTGFREGDSPSQPVSGEEIARTPPPTWKRAICSDSFGSRHAVSSGESQHSVRSYRLRSMPLTRVEASPRKTSGSVSTVTCITTKNVEASEDGAACGSGFSQLSAGIDASDVLVMSVATGDAERTAEGAETESGAALSAATGAMAVSDHYGRQVLFGSLMAVEVLAEREGCSEVVPEGVGVSVPWKDAVLAVAFAVRDERLRLACEEVRRRISSEKEKALHLQQTVRGAVGAAQSNWASHPEMSAGTFFTHRPPGNEQPAGLRAFAVPNVAHQGACSKGSSVCLRKKMWRADSTDKAHENSRSGNFDPQGLAASAGGTFALPYIQGWHPEGSGTCMAYRGDKVANHVSCSPQEGNDCEVTADTWKTEGYVVPCSRCRNVHAWHSVGVKKSFAETGNIFQRNKSGQSIQRGKYGATGTRKESHCVRVARGRRVRKDGEDGDEGLHQASILDLPTYNDALAVFFVDQPYTVGKVLSREGMHSSAITAGSASLEDSHATKERGVVRRHGACVQAAGAADVASEACDETVSPRSFAEFVICWRRRHPPPDAHAQLKNYLPRNTQLFAVKSEHELLRKTAVFLTLLDPSVILQWDDNNSGLGYLLRRAAVLGCDKEFFLALSRRIDASLLTQVSSKSAPLRDSALKGKNETKRCDPYSLGESGAKQGRHSGGRSRQERICHLPQESVSARILLNCGHILQQEVKLQLSTLEGTVHEVLGVTLPTIPSAILLNLWKQGQLAQRRVERRDERMMITAWKEWERCRIRFRRPTGRAHEGVKCSQQEQQLVQHRSERLGQACNRGQRADSGPAVSYRIDDSKSEGAGSSSTVYSCSQPGGPDERFSSDVEAGDTTWGVATMAAVLKHLVGRLQAVLALIDRVDVLPRAAELARLYGCDFLSALLRGSQYKVESVMLRATKRLGYVFASPSQKQVTEQTAPLCVPLVLEPQSGFYWSPVLVLDFQSLYPSIMIANNICFSTSLGSVEVDPTVQPVKAFGVLDVHLPARVFQQISLLYRRFAEQQMVGRRTVHNENVTPVHADVVARSCDLVPHHCCPRLGSRHSGEKAVQKDRGEQHHLEDTWDTGINVLPNGSMFVSASVRQGVFPRVLWDLLRTRVMIKKLMNMYKDRGNNRLVQLLNHRQHGLKMITNVSYGYTAASFTGHMPCAEVADAIVQTARTTLMRAIQLVENTPRWGGRVLYGDTDSLFVLVERKSLKAAFEIGREIAYAVTQQNPPPVELQLEKVFLPCCLVSKKRYVGYAYTSPCAKPYFHAKGIESVRRDQCGCTSTMLESTLRTFFTTRDLSCVKRHLRRQWTKILRSDISLKHFIFFRKCRLGSYKAESGAAATGSLPPQAKVAYERMCASPEVCDLLSADQGLATVSTAQVLTLAGLQRGAASRGERVPFVYANTKGNLEIPFYARMSSMRLLDFAVSPEEVKGGGRGRMWMRVFCRGFPQLMIRNVFSRTINDLLTCAALGHQEGEFTNCCFDGGCKLLSVPSDMEDAFLVRGYGGHASRTPTQEQVVSTRAGRDLNLVWGTLPVICYKRLSKIKEKPAQALSPLYLRYYIVKQIIPALDRLFSLLPPPYTVDLLHWYMSTPKPRSTDSCPPQHLHRCPGTRQVHRMQWLASTYAAGAVKHDSGNLCKCQQASGARCGQLQWISPDRVTRSSQVPNSSQRAAGKRPEPLTESPCRCQPSESPENGTRPFRRRHYITSMECEALGETRDYYRRARSKARPMCSGAPVPPDVHPCGENCSIKSRVAAGLMNELKQAEKQILQMEAFCEACAGVDIL